MTIRIQKLDLFRTDLTTRMPFRFGIATMECLPHVFLRAEMKISGSPATGFTADHLPPKWFKKDPHQTPGDEIDELLTVIRNAMRLAVGCDAENPFQLWQRLYEQQSAWGETNGLPPLLTGFGTALVEKAVIDAICRQAKMPVAEALRKGIFGIDLGKIHPPLAGTSPADWLPAQPLEQASVRHTIGLGDPIDDADLTDKRLDDGLPETLEEIITRYGVRHFKIKIAAPEAEALNRLRRLAPALEKQCGGDYHFTLDGNESFADPEAFLHFINELDADRSLASFRERLLFVEQPFPRDLSLNPEIAETLRALPSAFPTIIDESDATLKSLPQALALGYAGTSHKNCKGVFKGIANACLLAQRRRDTPDLPSLLSGEDLSTVPPFSFQQDLAIQALLGNESIERNGHHYFAGLSGLPADVAGAVLAAHSDLFERLPNGNSSLHVTAGQINLRSCNAAPFGTPVELSLEQFFPLIETC